MTIANITFNLKFNFLTVMLTQLLWTKWESAGQLRILKAMAPVFTFFILF